MIFFSVGTFGGLAPPPPPNSKKLATLVTKPHPIWFRNHEEIEILEGCHKSLPSIRFNRRDTILKRKHIKGRKEGERDP